MSGKGTTSMCFLGMWTGKGPVSFGDLVELRESSRENISQWEMLDLT